MAEKNQDFDIYAGEIHSLVVDVFDKNNYDVAIDLTSATVTWLLLSGSTTVLTKTVGSGITLSTTVTGRMTIALSAANSSSLSGAYTHQARATLSDGTIATIFLGTVTVNPSAI